jgi:chromosomal replication initiator protein
MLDSVWNHMLADLERRLPPATLDSWLRPCRLTTIDGDLVRVGAPNHFTRDWIATHHAEALRAAARTVLGGAPRVAIEVDSSLASAAGPEPGPPRHGGLSARYTFDSFVGGPSNEFALAACKAAADLPSRSYNPLFIYGGVGLGKTHLLHAVGHQVLRAHPRLSVLYISSERFTNELISAIRYDRTPEFRAKYRTIDVLLLDDVQFLSGKERTQEEFFHTFNDLYEARKQIILSSDSPPKEIPELEERLRTRFEWGLIADIQPPDFETRVAILKRKAELERVRLPDDVAYLIAGRIKANIREIEGSLTRMIAFCALNNRDITVDLAHEVLSELWGEDDRVITIDHIQRKVSEFFSLKVADLKAKRRTRAVAFPRQVAMYLCRQLTHASLSEVGAAFGGKDHTTVLHAVDKIHGLLQEDAKLKRMIDMLTQGITL